MKAIRSGFTLIEILLIAMLLGVGLAAVIGTLLVSIASARQASFWAMSGVMAQSLVDAAVSRQLITAEAPSPIIKVPAPDAPAAINWFETPWPMVLDDNVSADSRPDPSIGPDLATPAGLTKTYRVRIYDSAEDREADVRRRATYFIVTYLRRRS